MAERAAAGTAGLDDADDRDGMADAPEIQLIAPSLQLPAADAQMRATRRMDVDATDATDAAGLTSYAGGSDVSAGTPSRSFRQHIISDEELSILRCHILSLAPGCYWRPDKDSVVVYFKASLSLLGSAMIWVALWDLMHDEQRMSGEYEHVIAKPGVGTHAAYTVAGTIMTILTDTYYAGAGLDSPLNPREGVIPVWMRWWQRGFEWGSKRPWDRWNRRLRYTLRGLFAYWGMIMMWVGIYNHLSSDLWEQSQTRDWIYTLVGIAILVMTNTLYNMSTLFPPEVETQRRLQVFKKPVAASKWYAGLMWIKFFITEQGVSFVRCFLSIVAQNLIWCGVYGIQEFQGTFTWQRDVIYCVCGIAGMLATGSIVSNSYIDYGEWDPVVLGQAADNQRSRQTKSYRTLVFYTRVLGALVSQVVWWNAIWGLLDSHIVDNYWERNLIYLVVAVVLLRLSGGLYSNCGIVPYALITVSTPGGHTSHALFDVTTGHLSGTQGAGSSYNEVDTGIRGSGTSTA